jgi:hypothetical protein
MRMPGSSDGGMILIEFNELINDHKFNHFSSPVFVVHHVREKRRLHCFSTQEKPHVPRGHWWSALPFALTWQ